MYVYFTSLCCLYDKWNYRILVRIDYLKQVKRIKLLQYKHKYEKLIVVFNDIH